MRGRDRWPSWRVRGGADALSSSLELVYVNAIVATNLTVREKEVLALIASGHDAKSAARELNISPNTINERLRRARTKIGASSSREAARIFFSAEPNPPEKFVSEKFVLSDVQDFNPFLEALDPRASAETLHSALNEPAKYRAASFDFGSQEFLPLRKEGKREFRATSAERLRMIGDLTAKLALTFVAICLAAMLLSNLVQRG